MKYRLQQMSRIIVRNLQELMWIQLINILLSLIVIEPIVSQLIRRANSVISGIVLIELPGFTVYLKSIMIMIAVMLFLGFFYMFQFSVFINVFNNVISNVREGLLKIFRRSFEQFFTSFDVEHIKLWLAISLFVPMSFMNILNMAILPMRIPGFVIDYLKINAVVRVLYFVLMATINILSVFLIMVMFEMQVNNSSFIKGLQASFNKLFIDRERLIDIVKTVIVIAVLFSSIYVLGSLSIATITKFLFDLNERRTIFHNYYISWQFIAKFVAGIVFFSVLIISCHYLNDHLDDESNIDIKRRPLHRLLIQTIALFIVLMFLSEANAIVKLSIKDMQVYGHRGGQLQLPENTMPAFKAAIDQNLDGIELDIQKLASGEYLVIHDHTFSRMAKENKRVEETVYSEVQTMHAGAYLNNFYDGYPARFSTFDQILDLTKGKINLMVELKTYTNYETNIPEIIKMIQERDMVDQIQFSSMDLEALKLAKKIEPKIETTYIATNIALQNLNIDYVNNYSLQLDFLNSEIVAELQHNGKKVYTWTPNSKREIREALRLYVDGVITDEPLRAYDTIKYPEINPGVRFWDWLVFDEALEIADLLN